MKTILDYPMRTITPEPTDILWIFSGEFAVLDNFAATPVKIRLIGLTSMLYQTSEHAFAAAKAATYGAHLRIAAQTSPGAAKALGRQIKLRPDWEEVKFEVMWQVLCAKFEQHPEAVKVLRATAGRRILEGNTWADDTWGVLENRKAGTWSGRNALGFMLMELRDHVFC